jgi:hypothetical protein
MWGSRHELPLLVLGCPLAGLIIEERCSTRVGAGVGLVLLAGAIPFLLFNEIRPLWPWDPNSILQTPRETLYFMDQHPNLAPSYMAAATAIKNGSCNNIGFDTFLRFYKYPAMALLDDGGSHMQFRYVGVHNNTVSYSSEWTSKSPCAVLCLGCAGVPQKWGEYRDIGGRASVFGDIVLFSAEGQYVNTSRAVTEGQGPSARAVVEQMVRDYRELCSIDFAPVTTSLAVVAKNQAAQRAIATQEMFGLFDVKWQAREIMEHTAPMRQAIEGIGHGHVDYGDLLAASEALETLKNLLAIRVKIAQNKLRQIQVNRRDKVNGITVSSVGLP